jgi:hypothetical protein
MSEKPTDIFKPYWSAVSIENKEELQRLEAEKNSIPILYDHPIGPIYFIGYSPERSDRWLIPMKRMILEIKPMLPAIHNISIEGKIAFDSFADLPGLANQNISQGGTICEGQENPAQGQET